MKCLFCESDTSVEISRPSTKLPSVWRRRQCKNCSKTFSTREKPDLFSGMTVKKNTEQNKPFLEDKLFMSIYECMSHRKNGLEASRALSDTTIRLLLPCKTGVIKAAEIKAMALKVLGRFDRAAYTYYKAHHK
ncbi:MAG: hypothetical protein WD885_01485 [Candidatus Saccharimonadales bacterium]